MSNERIVLMGDDKEKLVDEILELRKKLKNAHQEIETLQKEVEKQRNKKSNPSSKEQFSKAVSKKKKPPHLWGQKPGHKGSTRPKPIRIDHEVEQTLKACPDCHHRLGNPTETVEHIQEDIVPAHVEVTRFLHYRYWCSCCQKIVIAPHASEEVPYGYLGPRALATMVWLKYHLALPGNKIQALLYDLCGLKVSGGAVTGALQRLANHLNMESAYILKKVKEAPHKHVDETGWTVNGVGHWLWSFVSGRWAFTHIDKSRGSRVPKELLGHPFKGVVVSDFFSAYNKLQGLKQKCLVHLRRDMRKARDAFPRSTGPPPDFSGPDKTLKRLLADAERLADRRGTLSPMTFLRRVRRLKQRLFDFASATYSQKFWQKISARLLKHEKELFTFLDVPGLPKDNNAAERSIRPHVIVRNRSFQNRTAAGANVHGALTSILQTLILQNKNAVPEIARAYVKHRQGITQPLLFTSIR